MYRGVPKVLFLPPIDSAAVEMQMVGVIDRLSAGKATLILLSPWKYGITITVHGEIGYIRNNTQTDC